MYRVFSVLNSVYKEAIKNREKTLSQLKGPKFEEIISKARKNWIDYVPKKQAISTAGIDSSFNSTKFQGMELWVVTAVSVKYNGTILYDLHEHGLGHTISDLSSLASKMEVKVCEKSIDEVDLVLMDGSLYSQFMTRQAKLSEPLIKAIKKNQNIIFISKTSNTRAQFEALKSSAGDIFYYNHATTRPGFSRIYVDKKYGKGKEISSVFARLSESTPLIKLELLGDNYSEGDVKSILDKLSKNSVGGYPYSLKLAHNNCKISQKDLSKLVSLYGLKTETSSREVLN